MLKAGQCPSAGCAYRTRSGRRGRHVPHRRPGVDRAGRGSDRLTWHLPRGLQRGTPVPERPPQGCRQARLWMRDSAGHDLLLIGRPSSASAHDPVLLEPQHRTSRVSPYRSPLATGQVGHSLVVIGIALGWVKVGRGGWRPRAGAGVPQTAPGRASYCGGGVADWGRRAAATCVAGAVAGPGYWPTGRPAESGAGPYHCRACAVVG